MFGSYPYGSIEFGALRSAAAAIAVSIHGIARMRSNLGDKIFSMDGGPSIMLMRKSDAQAMAMDDQIMV